jgi:hypothetical protein
MARTKQRPSGRMIGRGRSGSRQTDTPTARQRLQQQPVRRRRHRPGTSKLISILVVECIFIVFCFCFV